MEKNKAERIKREKDGLDVWADIERYAKTGFAAIDPDDADRFKWYGLYTQRPAEEGFFMLRVKVPSGILTSAQLATLGRLSQRYGRSTGDITTRQGIQFHYIRIDDVPQILAEIRAAGLTTQEACGDVVRAVVGCPMAGLTTDEIVDASPLANRLTQLFLYDKAFSNLPRKFKISVSGCAHHCAQHEINDIGLVGVKNAAGEIGFDLWVGGGLGAVPKLAQRLGAFVRWEEVEEVATRIVEIFRDCGFREDRRKARLKFLLAAWGKEKFRAELETRLGRKLADLPQATASERPRHDHLGIYPQPQAGLFAVGVAVLRGRIVGEQMSAVAELAERFGNGSVRLTNAQNLIIADVPEANVAALKAELDALDLLSETSAFRRGTLSCTGIQFCKLAVVETKTRAAEIIRHLETTVPNYAGELRVSVTGCVNSCAQYQIADVGLVGVKNTENGEEVDYFQIHLGGHLGRDAAVGRKLNKRVHVDEIKFYLERLVRNFNAQRQPGEYFHQFIARQDKAALERLDELAVAAD